MSTPQEKQPDQKRIVASLAAECHVSIDDVGTLYERQRVELASMARVTKFLHIFATRNVLEILRKRVLDQPALTLGGPLALAI